MPLTKSQVFLTLSTLALCAAVSPTLAGKPHVIDFRSPGLYPESFAWDSSAQHFLVGSLRHRSILSVSDAAVVDTLLSDPLLPPNATFLGLSIDSPRRRLLAVVRTVPPLPPFGALAAYDLRSPHRRLFLADLRDPDSADPPAPNDVAVDFSGNAYVTDSAGNFIWKVNVDGEPSIFSRSRVFTSHPMEREAADYNYCGLNGIVYNSKGYLLVVQSNTGKMFKVSEDDGTARTVILNRNLTAADGMAVRSDGVVLVVSQFKAHFVKSDSGWAEGVVFDETTLDVEGFPTSVAVGGEDRVYVLYGHVNEGIMGKDEREKFRIAQIVSEKESGEDAVWIFVLIGLGLAYFMFWRLQMGRVVANMNKKIS